MKTYRIILPPPARWPATVARAGLTLLVLVILSLPLPGRLFGSSPDGEENARTAELEEKIAEILSPSDWCKNLTREETVEAYHLLLDRVLDPAGELRPGVEGNLFDQTAQLPSMLLLHYYGLDSSKEKATAVLGKPLAIHRMREDYPGDPGEPLLWQGASWVNARRTVCYEYPDFHLWLTPAYAWADERPLMITPRSERLDRHLEKYVFDTSGLPAVVEPPIYMDLEPGELGSVTNPIRCQDPGGEKSYLNRLRCPDGTGPAYHRAGSVGLSPDGNIQDLYEVMCDNRIIRVYMDMYHEGHIETEPVPGFTIVSPPTSAGAGGKSRSDISDTGP